MDYPLVKKLLWGKLQDRGTYILALVVGSIINLYGQLLVPWLRGSAHPLDEFLLGVSEHPYTTAFSIFLGFAFPFCVGTYSAVVARYKNRRVESVADFPERKPDPVFRVRRDGSIVVAGARTIPLLEKYKVSNASEILGLDVWGKISHDHGLDPGTTVLFGPEGIRYMVSYANTANDEINLYLTRLGA